MATTSRDRVLQALEFRETDYVPCCFSAWSALRQHCADQRDYVERQLAQGLDVVVDLGELPVRHHPAVKNRQWREEVKGERYPILHSEYDTPAGKLRRGVRISADWEHGEEVPFLSDFNIVRSSPQLVTADSSLEALEYLLVPPTAEEIRDYETRASASRKLAAERGLATTAGVSMHGDMACWLSGIQELSLMSMDQPAFLHRYLDLVERWNRGRMEVVLAQKPDILIRRGWYENADFWSPATYREFVAPSLARDARQAHAAGAKLGYILSCSSMPLLDQLMDAGLDVMLGVDPAQDRMMDLRKLKERTHGRMALWGGVCGYLTVECGEPEDIRREVRQAISILGPGGGLLLAPVTNVRADTPRARRNVEVLIDEWKHVRTPSRG